MGYQTEYTKEGVIKRLETNLQVTRIKISKMDRYLAKAGILKNLINELTEGPPETILLYCDEIAARLNHFRIVRQEATTEMEAIRAEGIISAYEDFLSYTHSVWTGLLEVKLFTII